MGRIAGFTLFGLGVVSALVMALIAAVAVPVQLNGTSSRITLKQVEAGESITLTSMPAQPDNRWENDATTLFGQSRSVKYLMIRTADADMAIVAGLSSDQGPAPIMAVDPTDGKPLWDAPSPVLATWCAISRDKKLACLRNDSNSASSTQVAFIDPADGSELRTVTVTAPGSAKIQRAGNGFVVWTRKYDSDGNKSQASIAWVSSDGAKQWNRQPRIGQDDLTLSEAGNVVAVREDTKSASVYQMDTGALLYDSTDDKFAFTEESDKKSRFGSVDVYMSAVPHAGGFAVSYRSIYQSVIKFYDSNGIHIKDIDDIQLPSYADGTESAAVVFQREGKSSDYTTGVIRTTDHSVLWEDSAGFTYSTDVETVAGTFVVESDYENDEKKWQVYKLADGARLATFTTSIYQKIVGSDGERIVFDGDRTSDEPGPGAITAYDSVTGKEVWRVKSTESADDVNLRMVGPYLFWYNASTGTRQASLIRYG